MARRVRAVIVGGGPAGLATALALAGASGRHVGDVVVLEKHRYPRDKPCAGAISERGVEVLRTLGVEPDVPHADIRAVSVETPRGTARARFTEPVARVVRRLELDAFLARAVTARGVEIVEGAAVSALTDGPDGVHLTTGGGSFIADTVVGADGVGSIVRRSLGLGSGRLRAQVVEVDTERTSGEPSDELAFDLSDATLPGYAWSFPTVVDGEALVSRGVYHLRAFGPAQDLERRLDAHIARAGSPRIRSEVKRYAERGFDRHEPVARGRVLLVGEAAGIDPATGEGIAQALEHGALAGRFLAAVLAGVARACDFRHVSRMSRLGADLSLRARAARTYFDPERRARLDPLMNDPAFLRTGVRMFAGLSHRPGDLAAVAARLFPLWMARRLH